MGFVWRAAEHSAVLQGQMKNISMENLNTDASDLLRGPGQVSKTDGGGNVWWESLITSVTTAKS